MKETRANEYRAYLTVVGDFDPATVTTQLNLEATRTWRKGDLNPSTQLERNHSRWSLDSKLDQTQPLEWHVENVLDQLEPRSEAVRALAQSREAGLQLVAYFFSQYPGFSLEAKTIARLASLGLSIDCDFYYLYSDRREDTN